MGGMTNTWARDAAREVAPWMTGGSFTRKNEWDNAITQMKEALNESDFERLRHEALRYHNLQSYHLAWWVQTGRPGYNRTLLKCGISQAAAKLVGRLLVGGQGLRAGDPADALVATRTSCCLHCLRLGHRTAETLRYVTLECEAYEGCRNPLLISSIKTRATCSLYAGTSGHGPSYGNLLSFSTK